MQNWRHSPPVILIVFTGYEDDSIKVLRNINNATGSYKSDVVIIDVILAETKESLMLTSFDMQMFMGTEGRERTAKEWAALCAGAGYRIEQIFDTRSLSKFQLLRAI